MALIQPLRDFTTTTWRVPVKVNEGNYKVWIDKRLILHYTNKSLPDFFKERLAMINAHNDKPISPYTEGRDYEKEDATSTVLLFPPKNAKFIPEVGWRINEWYYCVVMTDLMRDSLMGESLSKTATGEGDKYE